MARKSIKYKSLQAFCFGLKWFIMQVNAVQRQKLHFEQSKLVVSSLGYHVNCYYEALILLKIALHQKLTNLQLMSFE